MFPILGYTTIGVICVVITNERAALLFTFINVMTCFFVYIGPILWKHIPELDLQQSSKHMIFQMDSRDSLSDFSAEYNLMNDLLSW